MVYIKVVFLDMQFYVHHIGNPILRPYVQYVLFNYSSDENFKSTLRSFANTNFCLGITAEKQLAKSQDGGFTFVNKKGIHSYLTGIYKAPYDVHSNGCQDEICIDFTPIGYNRFFRMSAKTFLLNEDVLTEAFGNTAVPLFQQVFDEPDFSKRGVLIERFLLTQIKESSQLALVEATQIIHNRRGNISVSALAKDMKCSERKIHRLFTECFDVSPKDYIRVLRFRHTINLLFERKQDSISAAYNAGYADQSHLIRELKSFTGYTPKHLYAMTQNLDNVVLLEIK